MTRSTLCLLMVFLGACQGIRAEPRQVDDFTWEGVERIVAIGDLHGDYENYIKTLRHAGLVGKRGRWSGGATHLVQTGDIPDRGPDTRKIMDHLDKLARQAEKDGGKVHSLIGNHEAMNLYGDLRYVTDAEFEAFKRRDSGRMRDRYFELVMQDMESRDPEGHAELPEDFRATWESSHPLGWVEHRQAWDPAWNPDGEYARRTLAQKVAVKINNIVFVHGGISDVYADRSLQELTRQASQSLRDFDWEQASLVTDECGPLWYRGLSGVAPEASTDVVSSILGRLDAAIIVVGHTPTPGIIWPRYDGRVVQIDTGISAHYGGHPAFLEITGEGLFAGYPDSRIPLPMTDGARLAYLDKVLALNPQNDALKRFRANMLAPDAEPAESTDAETPGGEQPPIEDPADPCLRPATEASAPAL